MPQTLLALFALSMIGILSLNQHQSRLQENERTLDHELRTDARTVASEVFDRLAGLPFDSAVSTDSSSFTPESSFGVDLQHPTFTDISDLDDISGFSHIPISRTISDPLSGQQHTVNFFLDSHVRYVVEAGNSVVPSGGTQTRSKEVRVTLSHPRMVHPLQLARVYTLSD